MLDDIAAKKGFSRAVIKDVVFNGQSAIAKTNTHEMQAEWCRLLYPVTPFVLDSYGGSYIMERLEEPFLLDYAGTTAVLALLDDARKLLTKMVWCNSVRHHTENDWRSDLCAFIRQTKNMADIDSMLGILYPRNTGIDLCQMIHGDPTLSNMMMRGKRLCLIDPLMYSDKIANHWTVDVGKMLQSAIGWEIVTLNWKYSIKECVTFLTYDLETLELLQVWFWCMVHCVRILPYTSRNSRENKWARHCASIMHTKLSISVFDKDVLNKGYVPCITRSILTEL